MEVDSSPLHAQQGAAAVPPKIRFHLKKKQMFYPHDQPPPASPGSSSSSAAPFYKIDPSSAGKKTPMIPYHTTRGMIHAHDGFMAQRTKVVAKRPTKHATFDDDNDAPSLTVTSCSSGESDSSEDLHYFIDPLTGKKKAHWDTSIICKAKLRHTHGRKRECRRCL